MSGPLIAEGFSSVTRMLAGASHGAYRGPGVSADTIAQAVSATEGLDAGQLVTATRAAVGGADATTLQGGILGQVASTLGEVAMGEILRRVVDHARDWFDNRDRSGELLDDSRHAADTLEDIDAVAETACTEVVLALRAVIAQLCTFLNHLDPAVHTREFSECVGAGAALIEDAGQLILDCCQDRDAAVAVCLDEFLARGTALCEAPVCRTEVVDCPPAVPPAPESAPEPVAPPKKLVEVSAIPQAVEPPAPEPVEPAPPPKKLVEVPAAQPAPAPEPTVPAAEPAEPLHRRRWWNHRPLSRQNPLRRRRSRWRCRPRRSPHSKRSRWNHRFLNRLRRIPLSRRRCAWRPRRGRSTAGCSGRSAWASPCWGWHC